MKLPAIAHRLSENVRPFVATLRWKSAVAGLLTPFFVFGTYSVFFTSADVESVTSELVPVSRRNISIAIKSLGTVTLANEQQLRFNQLGKVAAVHVVEGQNVKRDDLIAELDKADPLADLRQAQLTLSADSLRLQDLLASQNEQMLNAENSVRDTERQLEESRGAQPNKEQEVDNAIEQAKRTVMEKEASYEQSKHTIALKIESALADSDELLDNIIAILSGESVIRGAKRYTTFSVAFQFTDYQLRNDVEFAYYDATNLYADVRSQYADVLNSTDTTELSQALNAAVALAQEISDLAELSYRFMQTAVPTNAYPEPTLNSLKSSLAGYRGTAISMIDTLRTQQATLTNSSTNVAKQTLDKAKEDLAILIAQKESGNTSADTTMRSLQKLEDSLKASEAKLESTKTSVSVSINQQKNTIAQHSVSVDKAKRALEKYELRAPFDGVIRRLDFQVGDNLLADANETKYVVLENPDQLIVTVQLDQVDIVHVQEGQRASITFDALPSKTFTGTVDVIDTTPVQTSGVVSYEVKIALDKTGDTILSGMTAKVQIQTQNADNVLTVPNLALQKTGNRTFVQNAAGERIPVETGLTDGTYTEIVSGVTEGDMVSSVNVSIAPAAVGQQNANTRGGTAIPFGAGGGNFRPR